MRKFVLGQGWGMPFIVSPHYIPEDPEYKQHYKPKQQGCADCNGVSQHRSLRTFPKDILTCEGLKTIRSTERPDIAPISNREMDKQYVGIIASLNHARVINKNTRNSTSIETIIVKST